MAVTSYTELFSEQDWTRLKEELVLPPRQAEVLRCVLRGMSDKQIAGTTGISINTVRDHLRRLFEKCGSNGRVELIVCLFGYLREHHQHDSPGSASGTSARVAAHPRARKHPRESEDSM